ncbi:hypothetical protein PoB_005431300 [Plakobranchus ocellatus]|uniref:Uncharacterized protein n=1 Tax=Plakobranchus ocellatus TaxID=259542 RepID=A0AAV4CA10_9GAST|nr:hypothetical protein PoB_005431300 [Plakobranchus ocellatus]
MHVRRRGKSRVGEGEKEGRREEELGGVKEGAEELEHLGNSNDCVVVSEFVLEPIIWKIIRREFEHTRSPGHVNRLSCSFVTKVSLLPQL